MTTSRLWPGISAPLWLKESDTPHTPPGATGLTLLGIPAAQLALGPVGGILTDRWGARPTALAGIGVLAAGTILLVPLDQGWTTADLFWRLAVIGAGLGLCLGASQTMAMSRSPAEQLAITSASINLARQLGIALGPALGTVLWAGAGYTVGGMRAALAVAAALAALAMIAIATRHRPPPP